MNFRLWSPLLRRASRLLLPKNLQPQLKRLRHQQQRKLPLPKPSRQHPRRPPPKERPHQLKPHPPPRVRPPLPPRVRLPQLLKERPPPLRKRRLLLNPRRRKSQSSLTSPSPSGEVDQYGFP